MSVSDGPSPNREAPLVRRASPILGALLAATSLVWAADAPRWFGLAFYTEQYLAFILGIAFVLAFLRLPATGRGRPYVPWYDLAAAAAGAAAAFYVTLEYPTIVDDIGYRPTYILVLGAVLLCLSIEALRRAVGPALTIVVLVFIVYALFGDLVPGKLAARPISIKALIAYLPLDTNALLGTPMIVATTVVIPFIFIGQIMSFSGGASFFTDLSVALMGRYRGGPAKICIVASAMFGMISGSAVSNVATVGVLTIPLMRKGGYTARVAAAIEAVGSTGGQLMPPVMGAAAFLMAEFLRIPYAAVVTAAVIPALLYYASLFMQADLIAAREGLSRIEEERIPSLRDVFRTGWHFPIPFIVLIVAMFNFNLLPQTAALVTALLLFVFGATIGYRGQRMALGAFFTALWQTGLGVVDLVFICAGAGMVIGVLSLSGLGFALALALVEIGKNDIVLLLGLAAAISLVLGMGMPTVGVYVLVAAVVAPSLVKLGIEPIAAHMFVMYFGMISMITPPVALAAFTAASIAGTEPMSTGLEAVRFAWPAFLVPFLFVASPTLLMVGTPASIALDFATAALGIWLTTGAIVGFLLRPIGLAARVAFAVAGLSLLLPAQSFAHAGWVNLVAGLVAIVLLGWQFIFMRRLRAA